MSTGPCRVKPSEIEPALGYLAYVIASTGETQHMPLLETGTGTKEIPHRRRDLRRLPRMSRTATRLPARKSELNGSPVAPFQIAPKLR